jgi:uncharacterized protein YndB with AHSA1/START domain
MKTVKTIGIVLGVVILLFLLIGLFLPSDFGMQRQVLINAPAETVFKEVNDFRNWEKWSPFAAQDPSMQVTYGDKTYGTGANYSWVGDKSGDGRQFILESVPNQKIETKIQFADGGNESTGYGHWTFKEEPEGVEVTWAFSASANSYMEKYFGALIDPFLGGTFEDGLNRLKKVSEAEGKGMSVN